MVQFSSPFSFPRGIGNKISLAATQPVHTNLSICLYHVHNCVITCSSRDTARTLRTAGRIRPTAIFHYLKHSVTDAIACIKVASLLDSKMDCLETQLRVGLVI